MASAIIHMAIAKKINEHLKLNEKELLLGSIAPDIVKLIGEKREKTHFVTEENSDIPNINLFLRKYKEYLNNPYELGYYIHLLTDYIWFSTFLSNFVDDKYIISKDGKRIEFAGEEITEILYNDYSNLNSEILDYYNMDLSLFYQEFNFPNTNIEEVSQDKFRESLDKFSLVVQANSNHNYILDIKKIIYFIEYTTIYCLDEIKKLNL